MYVCVCLHQRRVASEESERAEDAALMEQLTKTEFVETRVAEALEREAR